MSRNKKESVDIDNSYYKKFLSKAEIKIRNQLLACKTIEESAKIWDELLEPQNTKDADGNPKLDRPLTRAERKAVMRMLCRIDRVYLSWILADCGKNEGLKPIAKHPWVYQRCREVERQPDGHLDLWARSHYKSTIVTVHGAVQELLINPKLAILILTYTNKFGNDCISKIKKSLMNPILTELFDDILFKDPAKEGPPGSWQKDQVFIKGNLEGAFASVTISTVEGGGKTGHHAQLLIYDDIVVAKSVTTKEAREKTLAAIQTSVALGSPGGAINRKQYVGTRWHRDDPYQGMIDTGQVKPRIHPATKNGQLDGELVYMSREEWEKEWLILSDYVVACQMLQNPMLSSEVIFDPKYLVPYHKIKPMNIFILVDQATSKSKKSDYTSIAVVGVDYQGCKYLLDGVRNKIDLSETWDNLKRLHLKWTEYLETYATTEFCIHVIIEKAAANRDNEAILLLQERDKYWFDIITVAGNVKKEERIRRLIIDFKANINKKTGGFKIPAYVYRTGNFFSWGIKKVDDARTEMYWQVEDRNKFKKPEDYAEWTQDYEDALNKSYPLVKLDHEHMVYDYTDEFINEFKSFPYAEHDDILDSISRIYDVQDLHQYYGKVKTVSDPGYKM